MTDAEYKAFLSAWENYPSQDNEGYRPDRGSFKSGFFAGVEYKKEEIERVWQIHNDFLNGPYTEAQKEVHQLREDVLAEHQAAVDMFGKYDAAKDENARLREALEWIATDFEAMSLYADVQTLRIKARAALEGK